MGAGTSKSAVGNLVITLEGFGTLYRFRTPLVDQWNRVAQQCGLRPPFTAGSQAQEELILSKLRSRSKVYPNNKFSKEKSVDPEAWWQLSASEVLRPVLGNEELPSDIGRQLNDHFSSAAAYELYADVKPFLATVNTLRRQYSDPEGPMLLVGIVTESDRRVRNVLNQLGLHVGPSENPPTSFADISELTWKESAQAMATGNMALKTPWYDFYNDKNDFDFLVTSSETSEDSPTPLQPTPHDFWTYAKRLAIPITFSRIEQNLETSSSVTRNSIELVRASWDVRMKSRTMQWIHVGTSKFWYHEAQEADLGALWVRGREITVDSEEYIQPPGKQSTDAVDDLEEAATVISLMTQEIFKAQQ